MEQAPNRIKGATCYLQNQTCYYGTSVDIWSERSVLWQAGSSAGNTTDVLSLLEAYIAFSSTTKASQVVKNFLIQLKIVFSLFCNQSV